MIYLKLEKGILTEDFDEKEALKLIKQGHYFRDSPNYTLIDIDKTTPKDLASFLFRYKKKKPFWIYIIIGIIIFTFVFILYKILTREKTLETVNAPPTTTINTPPTENIKVNEVTPPTENIKVNEITPPPTPQIQNGLSQLDLDLAFCKKDNESLDAYNFELLDEIKAKDEKIKTCENINADLKNQIDKTNVYIGIGEQIFDRCKTTTDTKIKENCNSLISNYIFNE